MRCLCLMKQRRLPNMQKAIVAATISLVAVFADSQSDPEIGHQDALTLSALSTVRSRFVELMNLANRHDLEALHAMFWQSPSALLVAKSAEPSEGNWAGYWGNEAIDQKLHDIAASGPVVLQPNYSKLKIVALTPQIVESYAPLNITVSYAGQDGTPRPFLIIIDWIKVGELWKVATEIILPVPPTPIKG
jgi:hypothetical protein